MIPPWRRTVTREVSQSSRPHRLEGMLKSVSTAASVYSLSSGRIVAGLAVVVGLIGAIIGVLAVARNGRRRAIVALMLGPISAVVGAAVVATAEGGLGTGHGVGGGVVAIV